MADAGEDFFTGGGVCREIDVALSIYEDETEEQRRKDAVIPALLEPVFSSLSIV